MDSIDLYVREVGRSLPPKMRADIEKELHSSIEDSLEDESGAQGRAPDEAMLMDVLQRLGSPEKMAASYLPPRYLIGPQLFPHYISALRIIISVVTVLATLSFGLALGAHAQAEGSLVTAFFQALVNLVDSLFQAAAIVTFIFAVIQWAIPGLKIPEKAWDPRKLKAEPDPERVKTSEMIGEVTGLVFGLVIFNLYPQWVGFSMTQNGQWVHLSVLAPAFNLYLPWLSLIWIVQTGRDAWLVARGRWSNLLRWVTVGLSLGSIAVTAWMLTGPAIIAADPGAFARIGWDVSAENAAQLVDGLNTVIRLGIGVGLAFGVYNLGKQLYNLLLRDRLPPQISAEG